jgi:hypothetical protein
MEHWFRPTNNPALIGQCERLRRDVRRMVDAQTPGAAPQMSHVDSMMEESIASARSVLSQCQGPEQRAQFALELLLNHVRARHGFLFSIEGGKLTLIAPRHGDEPASELVERLRTEVAGASEESDEDVTVVVDSGARASLPPPAQTPPTPEAYKTFALTVQGKDELRVVAALAVHVGERGLHAPQQAFLQAIARSLLDMQDGTGTETQVRRA